MAANYFGDAGIQVSKGAVRDMLTSHGAFLVAQDRRFRIERAFFVDMLEGKADERFKAKVLSTLPNGNGEVVTMGAAASSLKKLLASTLFGWANPSLQAAATTVHEQVVALMEVRVAKASKADDSLVVQCRAAMASWLVLDLGVQPPPAPGGPSALAAFASYEDKMAKKQEVKFKDLQVLMSFGWLLSEAQRRACCKWADQLAAGMSAPSIEPGPKGKATSKAPSARSQVSTLFSKTPTK